MKHSSENIISYICGYAGFNLSLAAIQLNPMLLKLLFAGITALAGGALGWVGKQSAIYIYKKIKFYIINKKQKP